MEKVLFEKLASKITSKRNAKGLTKSEVAKACGISPTAYANIEKSAVDSISLEVAVGIAKALNENFNELFNIEKVDNEGNLQNEIDQLKKRIVELESQLEDKKRLEKYLSKDLLGIKPLILNWIEEFHLTEPDFIKSENSEAIKNPSLFKSLLSESTDKEAELLAACVKGGYFSGSDVENEFGNKEVFSELMSKYRKLL
jgi:transcriptional regulator with XRE-family HTH domain